MSIAAQDHLRTWHGNAGSDGFGEALRRRAVFRRADFEPRLEEVDFDKASRTWEITVGFSRPWNTTRDALTVLGGEPNRKRTYKIVKIRDPDGELVSIKNRED